MYLRFNFYSKGVGFVFWFIVELMFVLGNFSLKK